MGRVFWVWVHPLLLAWVLRWVNRVTQNLKRFWVKYSNQKRKLIDTHCSLKDLASILSHLTLTELSHHLRPSNPTFTWRKRITIIDITITSTSPWSLFHLIFLTLTELSKMLRRWKFIVKNIHLMLDIKVTLTKIRRMVSSFFQDISSKEPGIASTFILLFRILSFSFNYFLRYTNHFGKHAVLSWEDVMRQHPTDIVRCKL